MLYMQTVTHRKYCLRSSQLKDHIYALEPEDSLFIGKRNLGHISNYYLGQLITDEEVAAVQTAAEALNIDVLDTRYAPLLYELVINLNIPGNPVSERTARTTLRCLLASADPKPPGST